MSFLQSFRNLNLLDYFLWLVECHPSGAVPLLPVMLAPPLSGLVHAAVVINLHFDELSPLFVVEKVLKKLVQAKISALKA